ncbi:regulation of intralumenal vesicle formation [Branchiostoma belcheri]|nr:regulation of intralumenal vesicle formation [Branchiostoma belcheri]
MSTDMQVFVRFNSHHSFPVDVDSSWSVGRLKEVLAARQQVPPAEIRIIFAGRELRDSFIIGECDLASHSIVHVVRGRPQLSVEAQVSSSTPEEPQSLTRVDLNEPEDGASASSTTQGAARRLPHFFVYCKQQCKDVQPGKLRVRCATCRQGTLTLNRGPGSWDDVLLPGRIQGRCQSQGCQGTVAEFYFKCAAHPTLEEDTAVALYMIKSNTQDVPCLACGEVSTPLIVFECEDAHTSCLDCFNTYCTTRLNDRQFVQDATLGYTLPCPAECEDSLIKEVHHFRVLGDEQYDRYQRFGTEECVLQMGGVLCPGRGCGAGLLPEGDTRRVECVRQGAQGCGFVFCKDCLEPFHQGECRPQMEQLFGAENRYAVDPESALRSRWERESEETVSRTTKPCPNCKVPVEKNGGCMHMTCPRAQCRHEWCWLCETAWNTDCQGDHWFG